MNKIKFVFITCLAILFVTSCDPDDDEPMVNNCDDQEMTYTDDMMDLFDMSCAYAGCHDDDATMTIGSLSTYDNAVAFVSFGRILGSINHQEGFSSMPKAGDKLSDCNIDKITNWVNNGTPE